MAEVLTPQQELAVHNRGGRLLVSAAAGSGKTKVLVDRLLSYILDKDSPANIDDFLIITFTKAAATELRAKIASKLSEKIAQMPENKHLRQQIQRLYLAKISTVHSFCSDILREYAYQLDIPGDFRIAEDKECQEMRLSILDKILEQAYESYCAHPDFRAFVDTQGLGRDDYLIPQIVLSTYNSAMCHIDPDAWLNWCIKAFDTEGITDAGQTVWGQFLIDDLFSYLDMQISALEKCITLAVETDGMEKPAALLSNMLLQMRHIREQTTWEGILENRIIDYGRLVFPKNCTNLELADKIKYVRNTCKKGLDAKLQSFTDPSERILQDLESSGAAARGLVMLVQSFSTAYKQCKRARRVVDYNDLEHMMLDLVLGKRRSAPTALAKEIGKRFREIMVDEYQDTNEVQDAIFGVLTAERNNCFFVGDVKQSIYQFRLADPRIFIEKYNAFVPAGSAVGAEGRKVLLSSNFRSSGGIIDAVNYVFSHCMSPSVGGLYYTKDETLNEGISHVSLPDPEVELHGIAVQEDTYSEEAAFVANRICQLLDGKHMVRQGEDLRPIVPDDIVILLRSPGSVGAHFMHALNQRGICATTGKGIDLLKTDEVCTLRSLLQVISNPLQDIPLLSVLMSSVFGFTADELAKMRSRNRFADIYGLLCACGSEKAADFIACLSQLRNDARLLSLSQLIQRIFALTGMDNIYGSMQDGEQRYQNLQAFCQVITDFELTGRHDLNQLLTYLDLMEADGLRIGSDEKQTGAVTILSIHTSKGLEFPVVILAGLARKFNLESARERVLCDKDLGLGLCCADTNLRVRYSSIARRAISKKIIADSISEEMRILYVAMTRARDRLIMTYASNKLDTELQSISAGLDMYDEQQLTRYVSCPGGWVLQSAMHRTEAGALFALGGRPGQTELREPLWDIRVSEGYVHDAATNVTEEEASCIPQETISLLKHSLSYVYPHAAATALPSKMTATQLKGRDKDVEVASNSSEYVPVSRTFRKAKFATEVANAQTYGNAVHAAMQYIRMGDCINEEAVSSEIKRLVEKSFITQEQADLIDPTIIMRLFETSIGRKLQAAECVLREFKFSVLVDAEQYIEGAVGEEILLQGVVDCAIIEPDGVTIIDFKTDRVSTENVNEIVANYIGQVKAYSNALSKIYQIPVKNAWLYFFHINQFVQVI